MLEIIAVKLVPLTAGICFPIVVILLFLLQRTDKKNSSRLLFISAACLLAGYLLMLATVRNKEKIRVPPSGTIELRYDARPIYAANLLLSLGLIGGTLGTFLKLVECKKRTPSAIAEGAPQSGAAPGP